MYSYSNGESERIIAKALEKYNMPRSKLVLLSKCFFGVSEDGAQQSIAAASLNDGLAVNQVGLSRKHIFDAVEASTKRLGTYIDVLQIHRLDRSVPKKEIMRALNDVVEKGWVRYIGASSMVSPGCCDLKDVILTVMVGNMGVPRAAMDRKDQWLARVHIDAELPQLALSGRRTGDDSLLQSNRCGPHSMVASLSRCSLSTLGRKNDETGGIGQLSSTLHPITGVGSRQGSR